MLYAAYNVSTRTMFKLTAVLLLAMAVVGDAFAANTGAPPQLVPYTINLLAGNIPAGGTGGYGGDGAVGSAATLSAPNVLAVDAVGNVYFPDVNNVVIREINAQTGVINTVAGVPPTGCTGTAGCTVHVGCADGVPALRSPISSGVAGIAIDSYGNIYFSDSTQTISVIYRGGAQVAAFIALENPGGVATAGGVKEGYVYHVAGTINLATCGGTKSAGATSTAAAVPAGDGNLAFNSGATFGGIGTLALDSAGNLYTYDAGVNGTVRVINTQAQAQTFFNVKVQPGYIASIANCSALTVLCPPGYGGSPVTVANTGVGQPAGGGVFNAPATGQGQFFNVDAYGNLYELGYKGETPTNCPCLAVAYAGGATLGNLINIANSASFVTNATTLTATPGAFYYLLDTVTLRPSSITTDPFGNLYFQDNHYAQVYRFDVNTVKSTSSLLNYGDRGSKNDGGIFYEDRNNPATPAAPVFCSPVQGTTALATPSLTGYQTTNNLGDGCPVADADGPGSESAGSGYGSTIADGMGNLLMADRTHQAIREVYLNNVFPARTVGAPIGAVNLAGQQTLQVHFDRASPNVPGNLPVLLTQAPNITTSAFSIAPGTTDFTISPISSQFTSAGTGPVISPPTCANLSGSVDLSLDCSVNVQFVPTGVGLRQAELVVTTANGSVYNFGLTGIGSGGQLAIDGGGQTVVGATGLGNVGQVAVSQTGGSGGLVGTVYIADPVNNRVVVIPAGGGTQTTVGTGLKNPMGVAVDAAGNVYISDTGNNRVVKVQAVTGTQTVLGGILAVGTPAYATPYTFKAPQGIAVDTYGNVYVADTGNAKVVMIPSNPQLGGATPLLQYPGAPTFTNPVSVALDTLGNVYVADTGAIQVLKISAGGGDLQVLPPSGTGASLAGYGNVTRPSGVAVDAAGNVYISGVDASGAFQVFEAGSASGPSGAQFALKFTGLNFNGTASAAFQGGALALDAAGNVYVADSGNSRVLLTNRQNPTVPFGVVSQNQPAATTTLYVTNIGNKAVPISAPFTNITSTTPPGGQAYTLTNTCSSLTTLAPGTHCTITPSFLPTSDGTQTATVALNGSAQAITLTGSGQQPLANIALAVTSPSSGPTVGQAATVTATLTQPNISGNTPTGTVTFTYLIQGDGTTGTSTATVSGGGTATLTLPTLLQGRRYTINATYNGDSLNSVTTATPLVFSIPGVAVTATASSISYTYGQPVPAITGTVTGITDSTVTYKFVTAATSSSAIGTYPITVVFSGGSYLSYGFPPVLTSAGSPAVVVESAAALTVKANSISAPYGGQDLTYTSTVTGLVNGDQVAETYTPPNSSILNVGNYPIVPTIVSPSAGNYNVTVTNGTLTVTPAATTIAVSLVAPSVLPTALSTDPMTIAVSTAVSGGKGTPSGTVTITDVFTPIIAGAPGYGPTAAPVTIGPLALVAGQVVYTPTSTAVGTHQYTVTYNGDSNFQASTTIAATSLLVDTQDFTVSSTTNPIVIAPGVVPGGLATVAGEAAATPETATVTVASIQSFVGVVTLSCQPQNPSYVTCTMTPPTVTVPKPTTGTTNTITSTIAISTPATLPLNFQFSSELKKTGTTAVWAFLPFGLLAFCVRKRKRLSKALWMLIAMAAVSAGMSGCGANSVHFFQPVPAGPQTVTIYATGTPTTTNVPVTRSFTVTINIQ